MNTGISTLVDLDLPIEELSPLIAAAGFTHVSLCHDVKHAGYHLPLRRRWLRDLWDGLGLTLNYIHPPLECYHDLTSQDDQVRRSSIELLKMVIKATGELGGASVTTHMVNDFTIPADQFPPRIKSGLASLAELADYAADHDVLICLENLPLNYDFGRVSYEIIKATADDSRLKVCLDSCHATMQNKQNMELVRELAPRVAATHFSDTMGVEDSHLIPGEGNVEFSDIARELGLAGYSGVVDLESSLWMLRKRHRLKQQHPSDPMPCSTEHYLERAQHAARRIAEQIAQAR